MNADVQFADESIEVDVAEVDVADAIEPPAPTPPEPDGQTLETSFVTERGTRFRVESFKYQDFSGRSREQITRFEIPSEPPTPRELAYDTIAAEDGPACAQLAVDEALALGVSPERARQVLLALSEDYRAALRAHVEGLRAARAARIAAREAERTQSESVQRVNRAAALVRTTERRIAQLTDQFDRGLRMTRRESLPTKREIEKLRAALVRQTADLEAARAELASRRAS